MYSLPMPRRAIVLAGAALVCISTASCSTYRQAPSADVVPGRVERADHVRILTNDGERFHAIVDAVEDGWVTVRGKEYRYHDGVRSESQRIRERYAMAELASVQVQGAPRLERNAISAVLMALSVMSMLLGPVAVQ